MSARLVDRAGAAIALDVAAGGSMSIGSGATICREGDRFVLVAGAGGASLNGRRITREVLHHLDVITVGAGADLIYLDA
jgi:hypothetical protein